MKPLYARRPALSHQSAGFRAFLEKGNVTESVLIIPLVLSLIFLIVQVGLWAHAASIAEHSAREAATQAATYKSTASGNQVANDVLAKNADGALRHYSVNTSTTDTSVSVTVRGSAVSLIPFTELPPIERTATAPIEDYAH